MCDVIFGEVEGNVDDGLIHPHRIFFSKTFVGVLDVATEW